MASTSKTIKLQRITVANWSDDTIFGDGYTVSNPGLIPTAYLYVGAPLNLLLSERQEDGSLLPQHIVLDPDFLVDVTTICRCFTHYGDSPATYLLGKFMPSPTSDAILLGTVANQFLDDCVNAPSDVVAETLYRQSLRKAFLSDPLHFATTNGIDQGFSDRCREQFAHIWSTVRHELLGPVTLESAFLCKALGIQGRMDLMTTDHRLIWELKSGKADADESYRYEHAMQMALYKESLYYNESLPYAQVTTQLFYSRYPHLLDIHLGRNDIHRAVAVRNGIVHLEHLLSSQPARLLSILTEQHFNVIGINDRFYATYLRPRIVSFLQGLRAGTALAQRYFYRMLAFVEREQFLAKTGIEGVNLSAGHQGFADTWRADAASKLNAGRLIPDLTLTPILSEAGIVALDATTSAIDESSNFRVGDMVMLYPQSPATWPPASTYISCIIERLTGTSLRLRLRYPQHDTSFLADARARFAIEPAHADASYTTLYRGLYAFLSLRSDRQALLLGQRPPRFDTSRSLTTPIADASLRDIVLHAKQALDYYLLVGPPGTGKTSVALRMMVQEFLSSSPLSVPPSSLLLMAFTNRAVDEICSMLNAIEAPYLRLGPELSCAAEHRAHLLTTLAKEQPTRAHIRQLLIATPIVVGTIASLTALPELFTLKHFRAAIIDEASQALEPHLLPLFCATDAQGGLAIDTFILIGDHKQLPAVVVQSPADSSVRDEGLRAAGLTDCRRSLFERLHELALRQGVPESIGLLYRQGRMHEDIAAFVNRRFYDSQLALVPLPHQTGPLPYSALGSHRMVAIDVVATPEQCTAKSNHPEALRVAELVSSILNPPLGASGRFMPEESSITLGIIVPFRGQITLVRRALAALQVPGYEDITIDTVERFQGSQRDIIIFSTVVHAPWQLAILSQPVATEGHLIDRKLNVAITRARQQFILVGNHALLRTCEPYSQLLDYCSSIEP